MVELSIKQKGAERVLLYGCRCGADHRGVLLPVLSCFRKHQIFSRLLSWAASYSPDADTGFNVWSNLQYSMRGHVRLFFGGRFNLLKGLVNPVVIVLMVALVGTVVFVLLQRVPNCGLTRFLAWRIPKLRLETTAKDRVTALPVVDVRVYRVPVLLAAAEHVLQAFLPARTDTASRSFTRVHPNKSNRDYCGVRRGPAFPIYPFCNT